MLGTALLNIVAWSPPAVALPSKPPESNAQALLFQALPRKSAVLQDLEDALVGLTTEGSGNIRSVDAKGSKGIRPWPELVNGQRKASAAVASKAGDILGGASDVEQAKAAFTQLKSSLEDLGAAAESQDREAAVKAQITALRAIDRLGALEVGAFPYEVTSEYPEVPRLLGRAEVEMTVKAKKTGQTCKMIAVIDGYSAPLSSGAFVDLASQKAFDGTRIKSTDESSVIFGTDKAVRKIPFEIMAEGDKEPSYEETLEEQGRYKAKPVLPFSAYGTLAVAHPLDDPNGGGNQFLVLKFDPVYTPAGLNTLDGQYTVVGYLVEGTSALDDLQPGDAVVDVKVLSGLEALKKAT